jgi:transposase
MPSPRHQRRRCRPRADAPRWAHSHICWWRSTATTFRSISSIDRARSTPARGSNSTARRCAIAAWLLDPVVAAVRQHVFAAEKIHGDDTTVPVLAQDLVGPRPVGCGWVYVRDDRPFLGSALPAAAYFYSPDRGGQHPADHMAGFSGFLQADGYAGFEALYDIGRTNSGVPANASITEVACWAHCRRKFFDVWQATKSPVAKEALDRIAAIYVIEAKAQFAPAAERVEHRKETGPLLDAFFT